MKAKLFTIFALLCTICAFTSCKADSAEKTHNPHKIDSTVPNRVYTVCLFPI